MIFNHGHILAVFDELSEIESLFFWTNQLNSSLLEFI